MTRLRHAIVINRPLEEVYALAKDVERYPEFLPGYLESKIVDRQGDRLLLQRKATLRGEIKQWKSWASFSPQGITFEHAEGPLKGMQAVWRFQTLTPSRTELVISHSFEIREPQGWGWILEKFVYKPRISELAEQVVRAFKQACENRALSAV